MTTTAPPAAEVAQQVEGDARPAIVLLVLLLIAIPAELVVGPLGAAGTPAQLFGLLLLAWWAGQRLMRGRPPRASTALLAIVSVFVATLVCGYISGMVRPLSDLELKSTDRGLLGLLAWLGMTLATAEGIRSRRSLDRILVFLSLCGGALAVLGIYQFFTGFDIAQVIQIPGLTAHGSFGGFSQRASFRRVAGTATHPIEFGVVLSLVLPIALHYAFHMRGKLRIWLWFSVGAISAALPLCVARTAMIGAVIVLAMLLPTWAPAVRLKAIALVGIAALLMSLAVPGLLGTLRGLVLNASNDPSTQGRIDDYGPVLAYFRESPWFGRGTFTFIPDIYRTLDNQYLGILVEAGILGVIGLLVLFGGSIALAYRIRGRATDVATRSLAASLAASVAVVAVTYATFDGFAFPMCTGFLFVVVGCIGALHRLSSEPRAAVVRPRLVVRPRSQVPGTLAISGLLVGTFAVVLWARSIAPQYMSSESFLIQVPPAEGQNIYLSAGNADLATSIFRSVVDQDVIRARVSSLGGVDDYRVAVGNGSAERGTDVLGEGSTLRVETVRSTERAATTSLGKTVAVLTEQLDEMQARANVVSQVRLTMVPLAAGAQVDEVTGSDKRALAAIGVLLALALGWIVPRTFGSRTQRRQRKSPQPDTDRRPHSKV